MPREALKDKRRGQPKGTIQFPKIYEFIHTFVSQQVDGVTVGEVADRIKEEDASKDTIRKYLKMLVAEGKISCKKVGKAKKVSLYLKVEIPAVAPADTPPT